MATIAKVKDELTNLISEATAVGDFLVARSAQETLFVLDAFHKSNEEILDVAFDKISEERRQFVQAAMQTTRELQQGADTSLTRSESMIDQIYELGQRVTFDNYPMVFRYRGAIIAPHANGDKRVTFKGTNFMKDEDGVTLTINGENYKASSPTAQQLNFNIPTNTLTHSDQSITYVPATLTIDYNTGGFLGFFQDTHQAAYDLELILLPKHLGKVHIEYNKIKTVRKENIVQSQWYHNGRSGCRPFYLNPSVGGRRFDTKKSWIERHSGNSRGTGKDIYIRDVGLSMKICVTRDLLDTSNGFAHYNYNAVEFWFEDQPVATEVGMPIDWKNHVLETIGKSTNNIEVEITYFTGEKTIHTPSSNPVDKYGTLSFDDQGKIIFRPKVPSELSIL